MAAPWKNDTFKKLGFEFIVIVLGVLTAFSLQTWTETINEDNERARYLAALREELTETHKRIESRIEGSKKQEQSTEKLIEMLSKQVALNAEINDLMRRFYIYSALAVQLGSYEALKASAVFRDIEHLELITRLNNLSAQLESTLRFQSQIEEIYFETLIFENDDVVDITTYRPLTNKVYDAAFISRIRYLKMMRSVLTQEFKGINSEISDIIKLIAGES